jgi:hypothetical protein
MIVSRIQEKIVSSVLEQQLTATSTRRDRQTVPGHNRHRDEAPTLESHQVTHQ